MLQIFTVKDNLAKECGQVFTCKNEELAVEEIKTLFRNGVKCGYTDNPSRYALVYLGMFDNEKASIIPANSFVVKTFVQIKDSFMQDVMNQDNKYTLPPSPTGDEVNVNDEVVTCG